MIIASASEFLRRYRLLAYCTHRGGYVNVTLDPELVVGVCKCHPIRNEEYLHHKSASAFLISYSAWVTQYTIPFIRRLCYLYFNLDKLIFTNHHFASTCLYSLITKFTSPHITKLQIVRDCATTVMSNWPPLQIRWEESTSQYNHKLESTLQLHIFPRRYTHNTERWSRTEDVFYVHKESAIDDNAMLIETTRYFHLSSTNSKYVR